MSETQAPPVPNPQKMYLIKQIGDYEGRLAVCEGSLRTHERDLASAKSTRIGGTIAFIIGLFMPFLWWPLAVILILLGALVAVPAGSKMRKAARDVTSMESQIVAIRQKLAELRAQIMMF